MKTIGVISVLALALPAAGAAQAATASGNLTVQASVLESCSVNDASISFGSVNPGSGTLLPSGTTINVTCTLGTPFAVGLGDGQNYGSGSRRMRRGATTDYLKYELHKDALLISRFGDATTSERAGGLLGLGLLPTTVGVFATVPGGQDVASGAYSDTVQITVYY